MSYTSELFPILGGLSLGALAAVLTIFCQRWLTMNRAKACGNAPSAPSISTGRERALRTSPKSTQASAAASLLATPAPALVTTNAACERTDSSDGSSEETDEASDGSTDSEYSRKEALRLKMMFVVLNGAAVKLPAADVAVLTATAGVGLVCKILGGDATTAESSQWKDWYSWWNCVGCGKITLKCPDRDLLMAIQVAAELETLPVWTAKRGDVLTPLQRSSREEGSQKAKNNSRSLPSMPDAQREEVVVVAIGPAPAAVLDPITGSLKLFS